MHTLALVWLRTSAYSHCLYFTRGRGAAGNNEYFAASQVISRENRAWFTRNTASNRGPFHKGKALQAEVLGFTESISQKVESGMKGDQLVQEVVHEWKDTYC